MDDVYIDKVLSGDIDAFNYFIKHYKDMAFNLAVSIVKDDQHAEEVIQDAFISAFKGLKSFNKKAKFKSWLHRIVVNESFQHLKKVKKQKNLIDEVKLIKATFEESADEANSADEIIKIKTAMTKLSAKESLLLNLFYLEEHSLKELVEITGWTTANIKVILHRGRKNIRMLLNNHEVSS